MSLATLNGVAISDAVVQLGAWGTWWADVTLTLPTPLPLGVPRGGALVIADAVGVGTIVAGGVDTNTASYRVVGGAGGWGREVPAQGYLDDAGVKVATVARDAAVGVGEALGGLPSTTRLGPHFVRLAGPASAVLGAVAPRAWYVGLDGLTYLGTRLAAPYAGAGAITSVDPAGRILDLQLGHLGPAPGLGLLVPGVVIPGYGPATDVEWILTPTSLLARVYSGAPTTRRLDAYARIFDALDPSRRYRGLFEFRVVQQAGERLHLQPVRTAMGLPDLQNVPVRPGIAGARASVTLGELVVVGFLDADPSRPVVLAHDDASSPVFAPTQLDLGGASGTDSPITKAYWAIEQAKIVSAISTAGGAYSPGTAPDKITRIK